MFEQANNARVIRGSRANNLLSAGSLEIRLDHLIVLSVGQNKRLELATPQSNVVNIFSAVLVEANRLRIPLNLHAFQVRTGRGERLNDLIDVNSRRDLLEPAEWRAHDGYFYIHHILYRTDPELLGDLDIARVGEALELVTVGLQKAEHFVRIQIHCVAHVERLDQVELLAVQQSKKHLEFYKMTLIPYALLDLTKLLFTESFINC